MHMSIIHLRMTQALLEIEQDEDMRKLEAAGEDDDYVALEGTLWYHILYATPVLIKLCFCVLDCRRGGQVRG